MAKIITVPNPILREKSKPCPKLTKEVLDLVKTLEKSLRNTEGVKGVGISAPQIGIPLRVFLVYSEKSKKLLTLINPEIIFKSKRMAAQTGKNNKLEGCLSVPGIWGVVKRHQVIKVRYQTPSGQMVTRRFKGMTGIIVQHEYDHLDGILFTDRVLEQKGKLYEIKKDEKGKEFLDEIGNL